MTTEDTRVPMTETDMIALLRSRYTRIRPGTDADRYVRAEHVNLPTDKWWARSGRIADYLVWDTYGAAQLIGHEIKVSRSDWLAELRDPSKAQAWRTHCNAWYLVVSDVSIVRDDLPEGWGLMAPDKTGALRVRRTSEALEAKPMSPLAQAMFARQVAKTATKEVLASRVV